MEKGYRFFIPGLLGFLTLLLFLPNLIMGLPALDLPQAQDLAYQWHPYYHFLRESYLKNHCFPLWNPYDLCGTPFLAFSHSSALYFPNLLYLFADFPLARSISILFHLLLAGLASYYLFRFFGASEFSALICSWAYTLGGSLFTNLNFSPTFYSASWLPLVFLFGLRLSGRANLVNFLGLSLGITLSLYGGDFEVVAFGLLVLLSLELILKNTKKSFFLTLLALSLALLLFFCQFLPSLELVHHSIRRGSEIMISLSPSVVFLGILGILGSWLYPFPMLTDPIPTLKGMNQFYLGLVPAWALLVSFWQEKSVRRMGWIFLGAGVYAFFLLIPSLHQFIAKIPVIGQSIMPFRLIPALELVFLLSACLGLNKILNPSQKTFSQGLVVMLTFYALLSLLISILFRNKFPSLGWELRILVSFLLLLIIFLPKSYRKSWLILVLAGLDLYAWAFLHFPRNSYQKFQLHPQLRPLLENTDPESRYFITGTLLVDAELPYSAGMLLKASTLDSWTRAPLKHYAEVLALIFPQILKKAQNKIIFYDQASSRNLLQAPRNRSYLFPLLNVRWIISRLKLPPDKLPSGFREISLSPLYVYQNAQALPRAFFTKKTLILNSPEEVLKKMAEGNFNYGKELLLVGAEPLALDASGSSSEVLLPLKISLQREGSEQLLLEVSTPEPGWLFLSESYYPGWKAKLDEKEVRIFPANYAFRAVRIPAGTHQLKFFYAPLSFRLGLFETLGSLIIFFFFLLLRFFPSKHF